MVMEMVMVMVVFVMRMANWTVVMVFEMVVSETVVSGGCWMVRTTE